MFDTLARIPASDVFFGYTCAFVIGFRAAFLKRVMCFWTEASGIRGGGGESVLLEVGVTAPAEQVAPAFGRDEAPMAYGASVARGDELDAEQSVSLPADVSVSRELDGRDDSGFTEAKETWLGRPRRRSSQATRNFRLLPLMTTMHHCCTWQHIMAFLTWCNS